MRLCHLGVEVKKINGKLIMSNYVLSKYVLCSIHIFYYILCLNIQYIMLQHRINGIIIEKLFDCVLMIEECKKDQFTLIDGQAVIYTDSGSKGATSSLLSKKVHLSPRS